MPAVPLGSSKAAAEQHDAGYLRTGGECCCAEKQPNPPAVAPASLTHHHRRPLPARLGLLLAFCLAEQQSYVSRHGVVLLLSTWWQARRPGAL